MIHKLQVLQASITWKKCVELTTAIVSGQITVINGKVYCGGGGAEDDDDEYIVYCYGPSQDKWTTLPPLPVKYCGLGQVNGKLVAVGGITTRVEADNSSHANSQIIPSCLEPPVSTRSGRWMRCTIIMVCSCS